ncbi:MerR family transcriptional regulator [Actinoallomurus acaciae]|uniref:MerR family transcriptional regulator n=1 Tax=Actinoallomurus acaciae TaxID=502577 RepID=A0ABV5YSI4_9ACTN
MNGETRLCSIGEAARRTGLTAKTVRLYSDMGLVTPTDRTPHGHRLYGPQALSRLSLVRTLRELGLGLGGIRRVLAREVGLAEAAESQAAELDVQIRLLQERRAVLRTAARREPSHEELASLHRIAKAPEAERRRIIDAFWDEVCAGLDIAPEAERRMRAARPELPEDPTSEQVEAWIELAELASDPRFRARVRQMTEYHAAQRAAGNPMRVHTEEQGRAVQSAIDRADAAATAGVDPGSAEAAPVIGQVLAAFSYLPGAGTGREFRTALAERLAVRADARAERYWRLLSIIGGRQPPKSPAAAIDWIVSALRAPAGPAGRR